MPPLEPAAPGRTRALLVDDGTSAGEDHLRRLRGQGYEVQRVSDHVSAVDLAQRWSPNTIFLAARRGNAGNSPFLNALKANDQTRHIPVTMLSSYFNERSERQGLSAFSRP